MLKAKFELEKQQIAEKIAAFAWRDQERWGELRALFTGDGEISVSWYSGSIDGFIEASTKMASASKTITKHRIDHPRISISNDKALAETDVTILSRASVGPLEVDLTCYASFFDKLVRTADGHWLIQSRTAIYEKDRLDSVGPSLLFWIVNRLANYSKYPKELRHLAYGLERNGERLAPGLVMRASAEEKRLKSEALHWLGGSLNASLP
jgi:SnoaL-like domain